MNYYVVYDAQSGEIINNIMTSTEYFIDDVSLAVIEVGEDDYRKSCNQLHYVNNGVLVQIGSQPSLNHSYNYMTHQWEDSRDLDEIKDQKWYDIKTARDQLEFGGFEFEGNIYDSDQVSQGRIMGAAAAGVDQVWTLADNTTVELSASQLQQLYVTLQLHIASVHERGRIARAAIESAVTKEEVEAIQL